MQKLKNYQWHYKKNDKKKQNEQKQKSNEF